MRHDCRVFVSLRAFERTFRKSILRVDPDPGEPATVIKMITRMLIQVLMTFLVINVPAKASGWTLNVPRVLLPLTEEGAEFKLFADGGCFQWKSTRPEVSNDLRLMG